jgi:cysteinyl-tRNA synthetase
MKLYNTLTGTIDGLKPIHDDKVTVYTCGPTVYDYPHIGNWFTFVRYDTLIRTLHLAGYNPRWVMNITDVGHLTSDADDGEDKLEKGARREGKSAWDVAAFYTDYFIDGLKKLNITAPTYLPRATDHIKEQIALVKTLETKGFTYTIDDGVYFDTSKFADYSKFARLDLDEQQATARVSTNPQKRQASDFALWKFSPTNSKRDMEWPSPWGKGFPGWHLECSAMALKYLGETIDIHSGGIDHIPVHHTNEIAQSQAATGKPLANLWMHTNHILIDNQKISKSLGNGITLEKLEEEGYPAILLRLLVHQSHYRTQSKIVDNSFGSAYVRLQDLQKFAQLRHQGNLVSTRGKVSADKIAAVQRALLKLLQDDLNTPQFLSELSQFDHYVRREKLQDQTAFKQFAELIGFIDDALGLDLLKEKDLSKEQLVVLNEQNEAWLQAKESGDYRESDKLKAVLSKQHIVITNHPDDGPLWARFK